MFCQACSIGTSLFSINFQHNISYISDLNVMQNICICIHIYISDIYIYRKFDNRKLGISYNDIKLQSCYSSRHSHQEYFIRALHFSITIQIGVSQKFESSNLKDLTTPNRKTISTSNFKQLSTKYNNIISLFKSLTTVISVIYIIFHFFFFFTQKTRIKTKRNVKNHIYQYVRETNENKRSPR